MLATSALVISVLLTYALGSQRATAATPRPTLAATEAGIANSVLAMLNGERAAHRLAPLSMNSRLIKSAHGHNLTMARFNTMSHQLPGEAFFATRISQAGYRWRAAGENIAWNTNRSLNGARTLESMMYNERPPNDGHRLNILSSSFRNVGIDVLIDPRTGKLWLTEDFGTPS